MNRFKQIYDISLTLGQQEAVYPGDPEFKQETVTSLADGGIAEVSEFSICAHCGTHLDLPAHFIKGTPRIESYPPGDFILPARVVKIDDKEAVTLRELERKKIERGGAVLFKTTNSESGLVCSGSFSRRYVHLTPDAARFCVARGVKLVGLDYYSVDLYGDSSYPTHHVLLNGNVIILEGINLAEVREGDYTLIALPLKIKGAEASPVRAVLAR
jgi:arylformamidase